MSYLVIDLSASKASMLQCLGILASAPVLPAVMMCHALDKRLQGGDAQPLLGIRGVGLIHRHCNPWIEYLEDKGYLKPLIVHRRANCIFDKADIVKDGLGPQQNSMQPMALADVDWTLLLDCEKTIPDSLIRRVEDVLLRMRLAGGSIRSARVRCYSEWDKALARALRGGYWVEDITHAILSDSADANDDPILRILGATRDPKFGWVVPVNLGYALLEAPKPDRDGARDAWPHAFAEHMVGAVSLVPSSMAKGRHLSPADLWRHGWDGDQFLVTNRPGIVLSEGMHLN